MKVRPNGERKIRIVCRDVGSEARKGLNAGPIAAVPYHPRGQISQEQISTMLEALGQKRRSPMILRIVPFQIITPENIWPENIWGQGFGGGAVPVRRLRPCRIGRLRPRPPWPPGSRLSAPWPVMAVLAVQTVEAMRAEEVALRLDQVRRAAPAPVAVEIAERG